MDLVIVSVVIAATARIAAIANRTVATVAPRTDVIITRVATETNENRVVTVAVATSGTETKATARFASISPSSPPFCVDSAAPYIHSATSSVLPPGGR